MFSVSPNPMDLLPILTNDGNYPEMEIGLFQTASSYNYAAEMVFCEIPTLLYFTISCVCLQIIN